MQSALCTQNGIHIREQTNNAYVPRFQKILYAVRTTPKILALGREFCHNFLIWTLDAFLHFQSQAVSSLQKDDPMWQWMVFLLVWSWAEAAFIAPAQPCWTKNRASSIKGRNNILDTSSTTARNAIDPLSSGVQAAIEKLTPVGDVIDAANLAVDAADALSAEGATDDEIAILFVGLAVVAGAGYVWYRDHIGDDDEKEEEITSEVAAAGLQKRVEELEEALRIEREQRRKIEGELQKLQTDRSQKWWIRLLGRFR